MNYTAAFLEIRILEKSRGLYVSLYYLAMLIQSITFPIHYATMFNMNRGIDKKLVCFRKINLKLRT